ncbi:hypothetical protein [Anabaena azotica]|uniref:Uncharacterized protein n=1 Tax=Anabaena azotica FACHB-119 TaxID=947527 RepID=A0ABR8CYY7_9NOST|nr:hypothetical protein [Anabaena azotica]MBD2499876.1 hypothetical protein [Anabaena azotica FACHB-119]
METTKLNDLVTALINHYSIHEVLTEMVKVCETANTNNPGFGWDSDKEAIAEILPVIKN